MLTSKSIHFLIVFLILPVYAQRPATPATTDLSTDIQSSTFATAEERVEFLNRYLDFPSPPKDAQFTLVYHDNSQGFPPGPADWDLRMVVWIEPLDAPLWIKDMKEVEASPDFDWVLDLSPDIDRTMLENAQYFEIPGKRAAMPKEGVVALWYSTF